MATAVADLHARLTADVSQYDAEMKRAAAITARTTGNISGQMNDLQRNIQRKFSLPDIGKDLMKGLGIGSGFAVAETAASVVVDQFRQAAESAKAIEESTARQLDLTRETIKAKMTALEKESFARREMVRTERELAQMKAKRAEFDIMKPSGWLEAAQGWMSGTGRSAETTAQVNKLTEALQRQGLELEQLRYQRKLANEALALRNTTDLGAQLKRRGDLDQQLGEVIDGPMSAEKRLKLVNQLYKERAVYLRHISELSLDSKDAGARAVAERNLADATAALIPLMQEELRLAKDIGKTMASSFEDAVFSGEKLSTVLRKLGLDVMRLIFNQTITQPLANSIGSFLGPFFGGPRATGGPVAGGTAYMVGERGPELFVPKSSGTIVPNHALASSGGGAVSVTYNIAPGVTASQLGPILALHKREILGTIADAKRRRTGLSAALA